MLGKIKIKIGLRLWAEDRGFAERFPLSSGGAGTQTCGGVPQLKIKGENITADLRDFHVSLTRRLLKGIETTKLQG